jgi:predicted Zn-dependent protease
MAYSQDFESEADYVGMYFMRRAGFDIDDVEAVWRRMAVEHPESIRLAYTHPTTAERFLVLARTRDEIRTKEASGEPLVPNTRRQTSRRSQ